MTTYAELKRHALLLLADEIVAGPPLVGADHTQAIIDFAVESAYDGILPKVWKPATDAIAAGATSHTLPDDAYEMQGVLDILSGDFLPSLILDSRTDYGTGTTGNSWLLYPDNTITFTNEMGSDGGTLFYAAQWEYPVDDTDIIEPPVYANTAIVLYMASHMLLSDASSAGSLAQYKAKIDSGDPEDNPLQRLSEMFLRRFDVEMNRLPMSAKGIY